MDGPREFDGRKLIVAPRRMAGLEPEGILERYFPGLEVELAGTRASFLSDVLDDESFDGLEPERYGLIVAVESFEHVRDPAGLASALFLALEKGGHLLASVPFALPLHEADRDYWRFAPRGLAALLARAGFSSMEVFDSGEEVSWDVAGGMPGLVRAWMRYPRVCFATGRRAGEPPAGSGDGGGEGRDELEEVIFARELDDLRARSGDLESRVRYYEELSSGMDDRLEEMALHVEKVEADNAAKLEELERVSAWARSLERELLALRETVEAAGAASAGGPGQRSEAGRVERSRLSRLAARLRGK